MKKVQLMTYQNSLYSDYLERSGYGVEEYPLPLGESDYNRMSSKGLGDIVIIEIHDDEIKEEMIRYLAMKSRVVAIVPHMTLSLKSMLLRAGVSDLFTDHNVKRLLPYLKILDKTDPAKSGTFMVLDDNRMQFSIISRLITRFGYDVKRVASVDDIFESLHDSSLDFILINLGTKDFDINELVRRGFSNMDLKRIPLVAYKDMDEGLFVHEMISGLNRLTRFIISPQELYSFLVDILFRKELLPLMKVMNQTVSYDSNEQFCEESISQIYFSQNCSLFELFDILTEENIETMLHLVALFKKTVVKVDGFRWLKRAVEKSVTCGVGAGSFGSP